MDKLKELDIKPQADIVNERTVTLLEGMLEEAKSGKLQEIVACGVYTDGCIASVWTPTMSILRRLGSLEHVKLQWYQEV